MIQWTKSKYFPWGILVMVVISSILVLLFLQQRYTTMLKGSIEYQMPVHLERSADWIPSDYLMVKFLGTRTTWSDDIPPEVGKEVYIAIGMQPNGMLYVKNASSVKPKDSDYMIAKVVRYEDGIVDFALPFDRVRLDLTKVDPVFYHPQFKGVLVATIKLENGYGIVTNVYSKGVPLELAKSSEQHVDSSKVNPEQVEDTSNVYTKEEIVLPGTPSPKPQS